MNFYLISDDKLEKYRFNCVFGEFFTAGGAIASSAISASASYHSAQKSYEAQVKANEANMAMNRETNEANMAMNRENIAFQQQENALARQREDNAYQRAVIDAQKAGLSPLNVSQASASAMTAPSNSLPMEAGHVDPAVNDKFSGFAQAWLNGLNVYLGLKSQQVDMDYKNAMADNLRADTTSKDIANSYDLKSMDDRLATLSASLDEINARIDNIKSGTKHYDADTAKILEELNIARSKLSSEIANLQATTEKLKADTSNVIASTNRTNVQTQMDQHNLEIAKLLGLPTGMIPSNPTQVGVMAGLNAGNKNGVSSEAKKEYIAESQESADKQYQIDLQSWYSAMERADKAYRKGEMSASEYRAFQRNNPKPKKSDYKVKKRK